MSFYSARYVNRVLAMLPATLAVLGAFTAPAASQDQAPYKWEFFGGYSFLYPNIDVHAMLPDGLLPVSSQLESNPRGVGASLNYGFKSWFGLTLDGSTHWGSGESGLASRIDDTAFSNLSFGPKFTYRRTHVAPFLEALMGDHRLSPDALHDIDKLGFMFGGGLDSRLSKHLALRLPRVDYIISSYRYGPSATTARTDLQSIRAQAGLVFTWGGGHDVIPLSAACSIQPGEIFAGEPVNVVAQASNFGTKRSLTYTWSGSGVNLRETGASTQIDTTGLQPGSYKVSAGVNDGSPAGVAACTARFTVKEPHPPVISCSSDPAIVAMGGSTIITSVATSPDSRGLTYSYSTSAGNVAGSTSTATLETAGAGAGIITVICNVSDDHHPSLTASASTAVTLQPPPPLPPPVDVAAIEKKLVLHSVYFATAKPRIEDPEAGLLASQEGTLTQLASNFLMYLQVKPDARLTLEGHADPRGSAHYNQQLSQRRVDRVKAFLVGLSVPAANIQTEAFGEQQNLTDRQVKSAVERNPELTADERQSVLNNMTRIILASNRRVDITLSNAGQASQESVREYPFNAADSLTLLKEEGTRKTIDPADSGRAKSKVRR